jgi:hypothetical protein
MTPLLFTATAAPLPPATMLQVTIAPGDRFVLEGITRWI